MDREQLEARIRELEQQVAVLLRRIEELEAENRQLRERLDEALRAAARQAAPFRRAEHKKVPASERKRPGREPGHEGSHRAVPTQVDEAIEVKLSGCPRCGGALEDVRPLEQYIEELPPVRAHVTKLVTYSGRCARCGIVRSSHRLQTSLGRGAAKVGLGPRALALGALLNKRLGVSMRNSCRLLEAFGLRYSAGGLAQALVRMAERLSPWYEGLTADLRQSQAVHSDETSWWVGQPGWWLWVFTTPQTTVFRVDQSRGSDVVREMLGDEFAGVLVSDCLSSYDPPRYRKHKCIAHHLKAIAEARDRPDTRDPTYLDQCKGVFTAVLALSKARAKMPAQAFAQERSRVQAAVRRLLDQPVHQPGDLAVQKRLAKQRPHLLTCLEDPAVEPTNNRAERALRPAVIARKISCGNRTQRGRRAWEILASLAQTCHQRALNFVDELAARLPLTAQVR
jgi:hypothetical protein